MTRVLAAAVVMALASSVLTVLAADDSSHLQEAYASVQTSFYSYNVSLPITHTHTRDVRTNIIYLLTQHELRGYAYVKETGRSRSAG